jgi:hypothetical protein
MRISKTLTLLITLFILSFVKVNAQVDEPVKWTYSVKQISENEALLIFDAKIDPKWHLYSQYFDDGGPVRMSFNFKESKDYKKVGKVIESPKPKTERDEVFEMDVQYFEGKATLSQRIHVLTDKDFIVWGEFEYQVCYDDKCVLFNPEFEFKVPAMKKNLSTK